MLRLEEWVQQQFNRVLTVTATLEEELASDWLKAYVESLAQQRRDIAPIDEPCYQWLLKLDEVLISE